MFSRPTVSLTDIEDFTPPVYPKTEEETKRVITILKNSFLTKNLTEEDIVTIAHAMFKKPFEKGDLIIKYGDLGSEYFILDKGRVEVLVY